MKQLEQLLEVSRGWVVLSHSSVQFIPKMFNGVEIRATGWPLHPDNTSLLKEVGDDPGPVRSGIVVLEDGLGINLLQSWQDQRGDNLVPVAKACQVAIHVVQRGPVMTTEAPPIP